MNKKHAILPSMQKTNEPRSVKTSLNKGIYYCPIEIIKGLTDKGQFQYLIKLKGPQVGNYLYTHNFFY